MSDTTIGTRGETRVHPTALVDPDATLGQGVVVGPWAIVGPRVEVGDGSESFDIVDIRDADPFHMSDALPL